MTTTATTVIVTTSAKTETPANVAMATPMTYWHEDLPDYIYL